MQCREMVRFSCALVVSSFVSGCGNDMASTGGGPSSGTGGAGGMSATSSTSGGGGQGGAAGGFEHCKEGSPLVEDVFDPGEVYIVGTLHEGWENAGALSHWSSPNSAIVGMNYFNVFDQVTPMIRPSDGRLIYRSFGLVPLREFRCDGCPYVGEIPMAPHDNDVAVPTPPCTPTGSKNDPYFYRFLVSPTGGVVYQCSSTEAWHDETGDIVYNDEQDPILLHVGHGDLAITETRVIHLSSGMASPITGMSPDRVLFTVRAVEPDKFHLVMIFKGAPIGGGDEELWEVAADGAAKLLGAFPPLPAGVAFVRGYGSKLDACGTLFQSGEAIDSNDDVIVRRDIGGASALVYTEATNPTVKLHGSYMVTGP